MTLSEVVTLLLAPIREVVEARPVTGPLALAPIVGLRFGFLLDGRFDRERAAHVLVLGRVFVGLRLRVEVVVGDVHIFRILGVESFGKKFFYALKTIRIKRAMARHPHKMRGSTSMMAVSFFMRLIYQRSSDCQEIF